MAGTTKTQLDSLPGKLLLVVAGLAALCAWVYWPLFTSLWRTWSSDPQYSHGYLVPVFAGVLLYLRWKKAPPSGLQSSWWGFLILAFAGLLRIAAAQLNLDWFEGIAFLLCVAGLFVLLGGWPALRWSWPAIAFLIFMIPLPYRVAHGLSGPLQRLATRLSAWVMETLGMAAVTEGNVIVLNDMRIAVVEACNGLSMLFIFLALTTGMALLLRRPLVDRIVIVLSAIPVALAANVARITATGVAAETLGQHAADLIFHDLAGWLMMPFALVLLGVELKLLDLILVKVPEQDLLSLRGAPGPFNAAAAKSQGKGKTSGVPTTPLSAL